MQLATITMDRDEARARYEEYRTTARGHLHREFDQIMRGYKQLSKGAKLIDINACVQAGGTVQKTITGRPGGNQIDEVVTLPAIAVMRADQRFCHIAQIDNDKIVYHAVERPTSRETRNRVTIERGSLELVRDVYWRRFRCPVPIIPPRHTPPHALGNYHIMWEADWCQYQPVDPALLQHIGGPIFVVLAEWDLTPLEALVLRNATVS